MRSNQSFGLAARRVRRHGVASRIWHDFRRSNQPIGNPSMPQKPQRPFSDDQHPFLTPKGLRLQQMGRKDTPVPMEFPTYPPAARPRFGPAPVPHVDPFDFDQGDDAPIYNVLPSVKFPKPEAIGLTSLTPHFESRLVANPQASALAQSAGYSYKSRPTRGANLLLDRRGFRDRARS